MQVDLEEDGSNSRLLTINGHVFIVMPESGQDYFTADEEAALNDLVKKANE